MKIAGAPKFDQFLRLKCGCEFTVGRSTVEKLLLAGETFPCPEHGQQPLKYTRPVKVTDLVTPAAKPDHRPGEPRRTPREEARFLVDEVFKVREEREALEEQVMLLRARQARLDEEEQRLVQTLAEDHALYWNPDR